MQCELGGCGLACRQRGSARLPGAGCKAKHPHLLVTPQNASFCKTKSWSGVGTSVLSEFAAGCPAKQNLWHKVPGTDRAQLEDAKNAHIRHGESPRTRDGPGEVLLVARPGGWGTADLPGGTGVLK